MSNWSGFLNQHLPSAVDPNNPRPYADPNNPGSQVGLQGWDAARGAIQQQRQSSWHFTIDPWEFDPVN